MDEQNLNPLFFTFKLDATWRVSVIQLLLFFILMKKNNFIQLISVPTYRRKEKLNKNLAWLSQTIDERMGH